MSLAITQVISADGGANQASVTTASFTPEDGSLLIIRGSCYASTGDTTAHNDATTSLGGSLTLTKVVERTKNDDGSGPDIYPPPITCWIAQITTGVSMTVTTSAPSGTLGFAHVCNVYVVTGHDTGSPIDGTAEECTLVGMALEIITTVDNALILGFMCDWGNASDLPDEDANTTTDYTIVNADIQSSWAGHRFVGAAGSYIIGTDTLGSPAGTNAIAIAIKPAAGALLGTVNQVTETDTAQAITIVKAKLTGRVTETDTATAIASIKTIMRVTETDTAQAVSPRKTRAVGQVTETSTVGAVTSIKRASIAQTTETDSAQSIAHRKTVAVGQATETDSALGLTNPKFILLGQCTETDSSGTITVKKIVSVGQVTETDASTAITARKSRTIGQITETGTANEVTNPDGPISIGQVTEADSSQNVFPNKSRAVGQVTETDTAGAISRSKIKVVAQVTETNIANTVVGFIVPTVAQVIETDFAQIILGRTEAQDTHGWRPVVGNHCTILLRKTFEGNTEYVKRRSVKIIGFASDGFPILLCRQDGTQYGTASVGIRPRSHPDADEYNVYVSF